MDKAIFAVGCFWGVQFYFDQVPGVLSTTVGYTGGHTEHPTYRQVCTHTTGHAEAVLLEFDAKQVSYETLVRQFFRMHDPTQVNRQGPDIGDSYRTAIFYADDTQKTVAKMVVDDVQSDYDSPIATEITAASVFWPAEEYHQKYTEKMGYGACHAPYKPLNRLY